MKASLKIICIYMILLVLTGCSTAPLPEPKLFIDQAMWTETTKDRVYEASLAALTMERFSIHPVGTDKDSGLIVTQPREFSYEPDERFTCYYTLQVVIAETYEKKVMVNVNAVDTGYKWDDAYTPYKETMKRYISDSVAEHIEKFFSQLDILLGKAEYYRQEKSLF